MFFFSSSPKFPFPCFNLDLPRVLEAVVGEGELDGHQVGRVQVRVSAKAVVHLQILIMRFYIVPCFSSPIHQNVSSPSLSSQIIPSLLN